MGYLKIMYNFLLSMYGYFLPGNSMSLTEDTNVVFQQHVVGKRHDSPTLFASID